MRVVGIVLWAGRFFCISHCFPFLLSPWLDPLVYPLYTCGTPLGAHFDEYILLLLIKKKGLVKAKVDNPQKVYHK